MYDASIRYDTVLTDILILQQEQFQLQGQDLSVVPSVYLHHLRSASHQPRHQEKPECAPCFQKLGYGPRVLQGKISFLPSPFFK